MKIDAKATGGKAAAQGTAGAAYSYHRKVCVELSSLGKPVEYKGGVAMKRDVYDDGSSKIYAVQDDTRFSVGEVDVYYSPQGVSAQIGPISEPQVLEWDERGAGAVYFGAGLRAYNVDVGVTFSAASGSSSKVRMEFLPPGNAEYRVWLVNGDGDKKGLVGMVWKV